MKTRALSRKPFLVHTLLFIGAVLVQVFGQSAHAASITSVPASPFTGGQVGWYQSAYRPFDTTGNLAFHGNGAQPAVALNQIDVWTQYHQPHFANDGNYGNGRSWVSAGVYGSWIKIDLGRTFAINDIRFGRDRLGNFNDRDPGQFIISVAQTENVYSNGEESNDEFEYTDIVDSATLGFSGDINGPETLSVSFDTVAARYVKIYFDGYGVAIDEVEVFGSGPDADGDGISDDVDNCPESNLEQAIIIVGCDSGVENFLFEDGCTKMSDLIAKCAAGAKNHGKFVSCVSHLTNDWKKQKLISGKEKGAIQSCAAQADIP